MPKFVPRQRKHKVRKRQEQNDGKLGVPVSSDSNAAEILPVSFTEKEEKRRDMRNALREQQPKASSKKQKRLEKYIVRSLPYQKAKTETARPGQKVEERRKSGPYQEIGKRKGRHFIIT